jgi:hypothetical protein
LPVVVQDKAHTMADLVVLVAAGVYCIRLI